MAAHPNETPNLGRVLIEIQSGASTFVRKSWGRVLSSIGFQCYEYWPEHDKNVNDILNNIQPTIFLGTTFNLNRALIKWIMNHPEMKVALFCSGWGKLCEKIDLKEYPIQVVSEQEKKMVEVIKDRVAFCHIHITDNYLDEYIGGWTHNLGIPVYGILNAADLFVYGKAKFDAKYKCQIGYCGGSWGYKGRNLNQTLVRLCREEWTKYNIKIAGNGWDVPQNIGFINDGEDANLFASSDICPNISEPHSTDTPWRFDIIERIFKTPIAGGFCISDNVDLNPIGLDWVVPQFKNYEEFKELIDLYLKEEEQREVLLRAQKKIIMNNHTYHHRVHKMLFCMDLHKEAQTCLDNLKEINQETI